MSKLGEILNKKVSFDYKREMDLRLAIPLLVLIFFGCLALLYFGRGFYYHLSYKNYYDNRIAELKSVLADQPGDGETTVELAMVMYLDGQKNKAINLTRKVYKDRPDDKQVMLYLGLMLSDSGETKEAIQVLSKLSTNYPGYQRDKTLFYLGKSLYDLGLFDKAIEKFTACVQFNPGKSNAFLYIGRCKEKTGDKQGALDAYRMVLKTNPNQAEAAVAVRRLEGSLKRGL